MSGSKKYAAVLTLAVAAPLLLGSTSPAAAKDAAPLRGVAGEVTFDCLLQPFSSGFRYEGRVELAMSGRGDEAALMTGSLPKLPGIAPVLIEKGGMKVVLSGTVDGEPFELRGSTPVDTGPNESVPVPDVNGRLAGTVDSIGTEADVKLTGFDLAMDEQMDLTITAECEVSKGANLGSLSLGGTVGRARSAEDPGAEAPAASVGDAAQEEAGSAVPTALWGVPALLVVGGLAFWLGGRSRRRV